MTHNINVLQELRLSRNRISSFPKTVFKRMTRLKILELNRNKLVEIPGLTFHGLQSLRILKIKRNGQCITTVSNLRILPFISGPWIRIVFVLCTWILSLDKCVIVDEIRIQFFILFFPQQYLNVHTASVKVCRS
jgi:hypothetical protein